MDDAFYLAAYGAVTNLQLATGDIKSHFQYHWNDSWDWAGMNAPTLVEYTKNGKKVSGMVSAQRNGRIYWLDRDAKGKITYNKSEPYVTNTVFTSIDPKTGRPTYNEEAKPATDKTRTYCPSLWGGKDWPFEAYNPDTGMLYIPYNDNHCLTLTGMTMQDSVFGFGKPDGTTLTGLSITDSTFLDSAMDAETPVAYLYT